ncbi:MAG: ABC transporter transmembrane domain-containing protein [bacterium]
MKILNKISIITKKHKYLFILVLVLNVIFNTVATISNPIIIKFLFDEGIIKKNYKLFVLLAIASLVFFTLIRFLNYLFSLLTEKLKFKILKTQVQKMMESFYKIPYKSYRANDEGYFLSRIYDDVSNSVVPIIDIIIELISALFITISSLIIIFILSWRISLVLLTVIPIIYFFSRKFSKKIYKKSKNEMQNNSLLREIINRSISAFSTVIIFMLKNKVMKYINNRLGNYINESYARKKNSFLFNFLSRTLMSNGEVLVLIFGGYEVLKGRLTFGGFMAFINSFWNAIMGMQNSLDLIPRFSKAIAGIDRIIEFDDLSKSSITCHCADFIRLDNVSFKLGNNYLFENFSMKVNKNEKLLITGPNGVGKTTLMNILCGFYSVHFGKISTFSINDISAAIDPFKFAPLSLNEHIGFDSIQDINKKKMISDFIKNIKFEPYLEKDPSKLSAGQRKIAEILITLSKEAQMYIFDEPLSNVDLDNRSKIMEILFRTTENKILIVIMHRNEEYYNMFNRIINLSDEI